MPSPPPRHLRALAVCVVRRDDSILVFEGHDRLKDQTFYRPLGGTIEFGEASSEAVKREFREEIGTELVDLSLLGVLENIFTYEGNPGHEIIFVYEGRLESEKLYQIQETTGVEDGGGTFRVIWKSLSDFVPGGDPLYPDGLLDLLSAK
jgi:ADP-ribose pyrophosphatase YjhB (NUDIX family)